MNRASTSVTLYESAPSSYFELHSSSNIYLFCFNLNLVSLRIYYKVLSKLLTARYFRIKCFPVGVVVNGQTQLIRVSGVGLTDCPVLIASSSSHRHRQALNSLHGSPTALSWGDSERNLSYLGVFQQKQLSKSQYVRRVLPKVGLSTKISSFYAILLYGSIPISGKVIIKKVSCINN